jgi:hypothetical protein
MRRVILSLSLALCGSAAGCSHYRIVTADPPPLDALAAPPDGLGQICVLRPHSIGALLTGPVRDNGLLVGATRGPSYFCYLAHPGPHRVTSRTDYDRTVAVGVQPGETVFLQQQVRIGADRFFRISAADAPALLQRCDYSLLIESDGEEPAAEAPADTPAATAQ